MDPLSLVVATATLLDMSIKVSKAIKAYVEKVRNPDKCFNYLRLEIDSLSTLLERFRATLSDNSSVQSRVRFEAGHDAEYWKYIRVSISYCQQTIKELEDVVKRVSNGQNGLIGRMLGPILRSPQTDEIPMYLQQIKSYRKAIGFSLTWISVYQPSLSVIDLG